MTDQKRDELRAIQDRYVNTAKVRQWVQQYGQDEPLFGPGSPSCSDLRLILFPSYEARIRADMPSYLD